AGNEGDALVVESAERGCAGRSSRMWTSHDHSVYMTRVDEPTHGVFQQRRAAYTGERTGGLRYVLDPERDQRYDVRQRLDHRGFQHLVEQDLGLAFVGALGESELADQNLPRLGQHPLLTSGKATVFLPTPQVAHHFGHLVDIAGGELLQVGLVPARPVGRLVGVWRSQHVEDPVQTLLTHYVAHADDLSVICGDANRKITLRDLQDEVLLLLAFDHACFDRFDECGTVVRVDDGLSDLENHVSSAPFAGSMLARGFGPEPVTRTRL